jgi:hypothetical protein
MAKELKDINAAIKPSQLAKLLQAMIPLRLPIMITGAPGIGKTTIAKQACQLIGCDLIIVHPVVDDPIDYKGLPALIDGKADFIPLGNLRRLLEATTPTVFFMDDLGQAPMAVQASAMQLILARELNGQKISDFVTFLAATNRKEDKAGVTGILEPVKSRFVAIVELIVDNDEWIQWASGEGLNPELISFIKWRPGLLYDFKPQADIVNSPSPRTAEHIDKILKIGLPKDLEFAAFAGAAGGGFAGEFIAFLKTFRNLPNPKLALENPEKAKIPTDPMILYALSGAISTLVEKKTMPNFVTLINRFPAEFGVLAMQLAKLRNTKISDTRAFIKWVQKNSDVLL